MKFLFDFFPILLFFIAFKTWDIFIATGVAIVATFVQVGLFWAKHRRFERMHIITLVLIVVFGGLTIALRDETFIKWKPTILNWLFGAAFLGSQFIGKKPLVQRMLETNFSLPDGIWGRLNLIWIVFFVIMGVVNLYVAYSFDTDTWVNFKLFGMMGLTIAFVIAQAFYLARYLPEQPESNEES
ncbi:MAG: septation protein A [Proteobacteria bacterium]|nr:MAG: septation protein A [Pseudomonadota bacterium]QKK12495.1 MAG: septation protein A [Pseudomonadota bacterium]